jgi:hypothetical protein
MFHTPLELQISYGCVAGLYNLIRSKFLKALAHNYFKAWEARMQWCVASDGSYIEGDNL